MKKSLRKGVFYRISIFFLVALILSPIVFVYPGWNPDDTGNALRVIKFHPFYYFHWAYDASTKDRFFPLSLSGHQLVSYIAFSPEAFFCYNYILAFLSIIILMYLCLRLCPRFWYIPIVMIFTPAFIDSYYIIVNQEKEIFFLWSFFLLLFMLPILRNPSKPSKLIFLSVLPANLALYFKETGFIMLVSFAVAWLLMSLYCSSHATDSRTIQMRLSSRIRLLLFCLLLSGAAFAVQCLIFVQFGGSNNYLSRLTPQWSIWGRLMYSGKAFVLFLISDPLPVVVLPLLIVAAHVVTRRLNTSEHDSISNASSLPLIDSLAIASLSLVVSYVALGIHQIRYLLPLYPFAILAIAGYSNILMKYRSNINIFPNSLRICVILVVLLFTINSMASSINLAVFYRVLAYNFKQFHATLIKKVEDHAHTVNEKGPMRIYIPGISNVSYISGIQTDFLKVDGVDTSKLVYLYGDKTNNWSRLNSRPLNEFAEVKTGDLFLVYPNSNIPMDEIIKNLRGIDLREVMRTKSPRYFEIPEIRHLMKNIMLNFRPDIIGSKMVYREVDFIIYEAM